MDAKNQRSSGSTTPTSPSRDTSTPRRTMKPVESPVLKLEADEEEEISCYPPVISSMSRSSSNLTGLLPIEEGKQHATATHAQEEPAEADVAKHVSKRGLPPVATKPTTMENQPKEDHATLDPNLMPSSTFLPSSATSTPPPLQTNPPLHLALMSPAHLRLQSQITALTAQAATLQTQLIAVQAQLPNNSTSSPTRTADSIVKTHIARLQRYNAIRDVGMGLMGLIADGRGVRLRDVLVEFGVGEKGE